jgi:hypothetical protein
MKAWMDGGLGLERRELTGAYSFAVAALFVYLVACDPAGESTSFTSPPPGTPTEIDATPSISVGVLEGDTVQEFFRVVTPFLLPNGRLVVPLAGSKTIRVFGPGGEFVESLGREGEGPGEFLGLGGAWPRGDTIEAFDGELWRITRFIPDGSVEVVPLHRIWSAQSPVPGVVLSDGWVIMGVADAGMGRRDDMVVHWFGRDGSHLGEIAHAEGMARYMAQRSSGPEPLSPRALFAARDRDLYVAETLTPSIQVLDSTGAVKREITWEPELLMSPGATFSAVVDSAVSKTDPELAEATRRYLESAPVPDRIPSFWDLLVDTEGFLWIRPFEPFKHSFALGGAAVGGSGPGGKWLVFSPVGVQVGSVEVPPDLEPAFITTDAMVGIRRDALGVESVRVHLLKRH